MSVSTNLELFLLSASTSQKDVALGTTFSQLEGAVSGCLAVETTDINTTGMTLEIPYDDSNELSGRDALHNFFFSLTTGASDDFDLQHPANPHLFVVQNDTAVVVSVKADGQSSNKPALQPGQRALLYCDGTNVINLLSNTVPKTKVEDYQVHRFGSPVASETIAKFIVPREVTFLEDFTGSAGVVETPPATQWNILVKDDGSSIGTITLETDGSVSFSTTGAQTVAAGSILTFEADATVYDCDGILLNISGYSAVDALGG